MSEDSVRRAYAQILERGADVSGLVSHTNFLANGETVKELVRRLAHSQEYNERFILPYTPLDAARMCYNHFLGRNAESESVVVAHANRLTTHGYKAFVNAFIDSVEYQNKFGDNVVPY